MTAHKSHVCHQISHICNLIVIFSVSNLTVGTEKFSCFEIVSSFEILKGK